MLATAYTHLKAYETRRARTLAPRAHMPANSESGKRGAWLVTFAAAAVFLVTMGARQSIGLFISPLNGSTGLGIAAISLALAVAQLMWGVIQPIAGAVADRYGPAKVLVAGLLALAIGMVPPTATVVGKLFGIRYLSTLVGLTLLSHQIGGFLGAYLGGLALVRLATIDGCGTQIWLWPRPLR